MLDYRRDVQPYLQLGADGKPNPQLLHTFYQASIDHRKRLQSVFRKQYPSYLNINRPKERQEYKDYRRDIYRNPLRSFRRRTIDALDYIRQADDFAISFPKVDNPATDDYQNLVADSHFTKDGSLENWFWEKVRKKYVDDPNAVLVMLPLQPAASENERVTPQPILIGCDAVYQFRKGEFAVLEIPAKSWMAVDGNAAKKGKTLLFLDADSYCVAQQLSQTNDPTSGPRLTWQVTGLSMVYDPSDPEQAIGLGFTPQRHECDTMPARKIGKISEDEAEEKQSGVNTYKIVGANDEGEEYYESILADALPHIEGAQEVGSDVQVERNFHVSGQEWRFGAKRCPDSSLSGGQCLDGQIPIRDLEGKVTGKAKCPKCEGGFVTSGSGADGLIIVSAPSANNPSEEGRPSNLPTPPGGFIPRNIQPLQEFVKEYEREKKQAYETVNMQFLMESPIDQSGTAKKMDREELYRTLIVNGAHLCGLLEFLYACGAEQRRQPTQAPTVLAPVRLSIENSEITRLELIEAVDKKFDLNLRKPLEKKLIEYQVGKNSDYYRRYELRERVDPYLDYDVETKLFIKSEARLTMQIDGPEYKQLCLMIVLSVHFNALVSQELLKSDGFWNLDTAVQYQRLLAGAEKLNAPAKPVVIDPKTSLPAMSESQLVPTVDIKNAHQLK